MATDDPIADRLRKFLSRFFRNHELQYDEDIFALGFVDSLLTMNLVVFIEDVFQIQLEDEDLDLDNFRSIHAMENLIKRKQATSVTP